MDSVEQLFRLHYAYVCNIINRYVQDRVRTEDIAQDMFAELWSKRDQLTIHTSESAYLRRMAISRSLNYLRDTRKYNWDELETAVHKEKDTGHREADIILNLELEELQARLERAIQELPEKCRIVFLLSRHDEMSYAEIAGQLQISIKTVENQIGKALKLLRVAVAEHRGRTE